MCQKGLLDEFASTANGLTPPVEQDANSDERWLRRLRRRQQQLWSPDEAKFRHSPEKVFDVLVVLSLNISPRMVMNFSRSCFLKS
jgi:hypothetical protein